MLKTITFMILFLCFTYGDGVFPEPPSIPDIQAFGSHEAVYLYWNKDAENSIDPYTGYADFEGYRLYRSSDGGQTWGKLFDKLFDYSGNQVGWHPIVQYDYSEKQDTSRCSYVNDFEYNTGQPCEVNDDKYKRNIDVSGYDPLALWKNIGENSGIFRLYTDTTVIDGVEYMYVITAYDMGLRTYEVEFSPENTIPAEEFIDCGVDGSGDPICETNPSWDDEYGNGIWDDGEYLFDCGIYYTGLQLKCSEDTEEFIDCGVDDDGDPICEDNPNWDDLYGNGFWDDGEDWTDCGVDGDGNKICETDDFWDDTYGNGAYDNGGWNADLGNGVWDDEHIIYESDTTWSDSNPEHFIAPDGWELDSKKGLPSFESPFLYESFTDYNVNGTWDDGEPFTDENDNQIWDERIDPINAITITPGYLASNIETFGDEGVEYDFLIADSLNIGNGWVNINVVNEAEIRPSLVRFEIDACLDRAGYGDQNGSFATGCINESQVDCAPGCLELGPPSLYCQPVSSKNILVIPSPSS